MARIRIHSVIYPSCTHGEGRYHDCEYVDRRNLAIPFAEVLAHEYVRVYDAPNGWSAAFHRFMDIINGDDVEAYKAAMKRAYELMGRHGAA